MGATMQQREAIKYLLKQGLLDEVEAAERLAGLETFADGVEQGAKATGPRRQPRPRNGKKAAAYSRSLALTRAALVRRGDRAVVSSIKIADICHKNGWDVQDYVAWGMSHNRLTECNKKKGTYYVHDIPDVLKQLRKDFPDGANVELAEMAGVSPTWFAADGSVRKLQGRKG